MNKKYTINMTDLMYKDLMDSNLVRSINYLPGINRCSTFESKLSAMQLTILFDFNEDDFLRRSSNYYDGIIIIKDERSIVEHYKLIDLLEHFEADISYDNNIIFYFKIWQKEICYVLDKMKISFDLTTT